MRVLCKIVLCNFYIYYQQQAIFYRLLTEVLSLLNFENTWEKSFNFEENKMDFIKPFLQPWGTWGFSAKRALLYFH